MTARVIQGYFVGRGPVRDLGPVAPRAGRPALQVQAKAPPGRPALAHAPASTGARPPGDGSFEVDPTRLGLARGGGAALPQALLAKMEGAFGADFSQVRVHVGPQAARIGAIAFTTGNDVYFAPGRYQPESMIGQQLLGHELAHVIQQRQGRVRAPGGGVSVVHDRMLEAEADRMGARAAAHRVPVQRKAATVRISASTRDPTGACRVSAGAAGREVGSLRVRPAGGSVEVTDLGVQPGYRDQGLGRQLLARAAQAGVSMGKSRVRLAAQDNGSGRLTRWYKAMGFTQIGFNARGYAELEAPAARLLSAPLQRQADTDACKANSTVGFTVPFPGGNGRVTRPGSAFPRAIQRAAPADDGKEGDYKGDMTAVGVIAAWLKETDGQSGAQVSNYSVGLTDKGAFIISKVGGITEKAKMGGLIKAYFAKTYPQAAVYLAPAYSGASPSGNHAEMCVAAGQNAETGKVLAIVCTHPNCDLCVTQMTKMGIKGSSITEGSGGPQLTWLHPTEAAYFGTSTGGTMSEAVIALEAFNKGQPVPKGGAKGAIPPKIGNAKKL